MNSFVRVLSNTSFCGASWVLSRHHLRCRCLLLSPRRRRHRCRLWLHPRMWQIHCRLWRCRCSLAGAEIVDHCACQHSVPGVAVCRQGRVPQSWRLTLCVHFPCGGLFSYKKLWLLGVCISEIIITTNYIMHNATHSIFYFSASSSLTTALPFPCCVRSRAQQSY